jgi:UDP-N-acetylmuramate--alanine ligase
MKILPLTSKLSLEVGTIHFVGIGGIGMSGIAEVLHNLGFKVQGSDLSVNYNTERLGKMGIKVVQGQKPENIEGASVVVISSAVKPSNPEVVAAREAHIPVVRRSEMLAELMRLKIAIAIAGTHGKTTTTTMMATLLNEAKFDPTVINGGIINFLGSNAHLGQGEWMVVEADESDGTFNKIPATVAVVTNIEPEHLDFYGSFDKAREAFKSFVSNIPFYGFAVMCHDHPEVQALIGQIQDRRIISYGLSPQADVRASNIRTDASGSTYDALLGDKVIKDIHVPIPGNHNILNSLAVVAVGHELKIRDEVIKKAFAGFEGVKRRFTKVGEANGITIIDDYGHHPTEIMATLQAARSVTKGNVIAVVQPHRFTRVRDLFDEFCKCFNDADKVIVTDIYTAGEEPIEGINRDSLVQGIKQHGHKSVTPLLAEADLPKLIAENAKSGDIVVCLGAGSITYMAAKLEGQIKGLSGKVA